MKTMLEIQTEQRRASKREHLCSMREAAMGFREAIAPDHLLQPTLSERASDGATHLARAISYRDMARDLGRWAKGAS